MRQIQKGLRFFLTVIFFGILLLSQSAFAKTKVLIVYSQIAEPYTSFMWHFHQSLKDQDDLDFDTINLNNREKIVSRLLAKYHTDQPEIILAIGTIALRAVQYQRVLDQDIPVLFGMVSDPVGEGVIQSFNEPPTKRFSGISFAVDIRDRLRDLKNLMPNIKRIGVIYSTMPQSVSFKKWLDKAAQEEEFQNLEFVYRRIGMLPYKNGPHDMIHMAKKHVIDIKNQVDAYLSPNDQMGILPAFSQMIVRETDKPVFGLFKKDVNADKGAVAASAPRLSSAGQKMAEQLLRLKAGEPIFAIMPEQPEYDFMVNQATLDHFLIQQEGF